jgi:hypothetical protein
LAAQVEPSITPDRFWALALKTGRTIDLRRGDRERRFGPILDAARLVDALRRGGLADEAAVAAELAKYYPPATPESREAETRRAHVSKELAARIDKLKLGSTARQEVIALLGEPASYVLGRERLDANDLPNRFAMIYPSNVQIIVSGERVERVTIVNPGYRFRGTIEVGTSMEEVFNVLGPPRRTIDGADYSDIRNVTEDNVVFDRLGGVAGNAFYRNEAEGVALYCRQGRVMQIMLLPQRHPRESDP